MAGILHGSARTTPRVRAELQASKKRANLEQVGKASPSVDTPVSKEDYLAFAEIFFDKADAKRKQGAAPGSGMLDIGELSSADGKKLIGLLQ